MKRIIKIKALLIFLLFTSSCGAFFDMPPDDWNWGLKPRPMVGFKNFPSASTEYGKGFKDGCETAFDAVTKGLMADINDKRYDYKRMLKSSDYNRGWFDGLEQCTYIFDWDIL